MLKTRLNIAIVLSLLSAPTAYSKKAPNLTSEDLAQIAERGRALCAYDQAAWHATDAVLATHPNEGEDGRYIARKADAGWVVAFGHLSSTRDSFLIAHLATEGKTPQEFSG